MTAIDPDDLIFALAKATAIKRDLFRVTLDEAAERWNMTPAEIVEALAWYSRAEPHYRGSPEAAEAARRAGEMRRTPRAPMRPAAEHRSHGDESNLGWTIDRPDRTRPARPCANCARAFQPTQRRRVLCYTCFARGDGGGGAEGEGDGGSKGYRTPNPVPDLDVPF
ncbi:MAG: hypothetical protein OXC10_14520 [Rhodospirillaceae bacterium]|nr:hypothetical protein [Rhodospirillaceae bacterium]